MQLMGRQSLTSCYAENFTMIREERTPHMWRQAVELVF